MKIIPSWLINTDDLVSITPQSCHETLRFMENSCCCEPRVAEEEEEVTVAIVEDSTTDNRETAWMVTTEDLVSAAPEGCQGTLASMRATSIPCCGAGSREEPQAAANGVTLGSSGEGYQDSSNTSFGLETVELQQRNSGDFINPGAPPPEAFQMMATKGDEYEGGSHFMDDDMVELLETV